MPTKCEFCPLRKRDAFVPMTEDEVRFMNRFKVGELVVDAGAPILMEGTNSPQLFTTLRGMGVRFKMMESGRRQVINFIFPGDFIGMQAGIMGEMGHSVEATTRMTLCVFDRSGIWNLFRQHPERAFDLTWIVAEEEHFLGESLMSVGQRSAIQAVAWALAKVFIRGQALGMVQDSSMQFPFRQQDLADALGLSLVHTNKTLAKLRARQLVAWSGDQLVVRNLPGLAEVAEITLEQERPRPIM